MQLLCATICHGSFCPVTGGVSYVGSASRGPLSLALSVLEFVLEFVIVRFESMERPIA